MLYLKKAFYLPVALFIRPSIFIVHSHMNLIYQFWIHTNVIYTLLFLNQYFLNKYKLLRLSKVSARLNTY